MAKIKSYTDIEQSKVLAEILPLDSADYFYKYCIGHYNSIYYRLEMYPYNEGGNKNHDIPCWSLAALLNLLPSEFTQKGKYSTTTYKIDIRKYKFTDDIDLHQIAYGSIKFDVDGQYSFKDMVNTGEKENLVDACYQMLLELKKRNLI